MLASGPRTPLAVGKWKHRLSVSPSPSSQGKAGGAPTATRDGRRQRRRGGGGKFLLILFFVSCQLFFLL